MCAESPLLQRDRHTSFVLVKGIVLLLEVFLLFPCYFIEEVFGLRIGGQEPDGLIEEQRVIWAKYSPNSLTKGPVFWFSIV